MAPKFWMELRRLTMTFLRGHGQRPLGQADRDNHRQHFRRQTDRHGQRKEKRLLPIVLVQAVDEKNHRHHHRHETQHQPGESLDPFVEARLDRLGGDAFGDSAQISLRTRFHHQTRRRAALHAGAQKTEIRELQRRNVLPRFPGVELLHRQDSPVNVAWMMKRSLHASTRTSPGIMSPAESLTMSPGTNWRNGTSRVLPSRMTVAVTLIMALSLAAAASARDSWMKRNATPRMTMTTMIQPPAMSLGSAAVAKVMIARTENKMTSGLRTACQRRPSQSWRFSRETSFGPTSSNRSAGDRLGHSVRRRFQQSQGLRGLHSGGLGQTGGELDIGRCCAWAARRRPWRLGQSGRVFRCQPCFCFAIYAGRMHRQGGPENRKWEGGNRQANPQEFFHHPSFILSRGPHLKPRTPKTFGAGVVIFSRGICPVNKL